MMARQRARRNACWPVEVADANRRAHGRERVLRPAGGAVLYVCRSSRLGAARTCEAGRTWGGGLAQVGGRLGVLHTRTHLPISIRPERSWKSQPIKMADAIERRRHSALYMHFLAGSAIVDVGGRHDGRH